MKALQNTLATTALLAAILASPFAAAHATLKASNPQAGAVLATAPPEVSLTFNEKVEEAFSSITVNAADGKPVTAQKSRVDSQDHAVLRLELPPLNAGEYAVKWAAAGHDGHRRTGDFKFTVK
ncbi:copper resistance protein CopC [Pseudoduganella sp. UC29_106]|uniref:copper resistance CopC family protein n=1 Tax=Pseudoduganella sp. UC29_106 TaxID=3374553 RepID=UPI0037582CB7